MTNLLKRLQEITGNQLCLNPEKINPTADFVKELGADSLDVIELVIAIEYEFDIDISDSYASRINTLQDVLNYIENTSNTTK